MLINTICRVCLVVNSRVRSILNTLLQQMYEKITDIPLFSSEGKPYTVCNICHALLSKSEALKTKAQRADQILTELLHDGKELFEKKSEILIGPNDSLHVELTTVVFEEAHISGNGGEDEIKEDNGKKEEDVKEELLEQTLEEAGLEEKNIDRVIESDNASAEDILKDESDSDDNIPLKNISTKKRALKNRVRVKKRERFKTEKGFSADYAKEIILSREEQIQEILNRAKSQNYMNSPLKCELCYKGFVDTKAYENHKRKHDVGAGPHQCPVCHMRYLSSRQLKTHAATSHERRYQCRRCPHRAHTANQAREHEKWHRGFMYECQLCSHQFSKPTSYLSHMRKSHPTHHVCDICGESFIGRHGLLMHRSKTHRGEKPENSSEPPSERFCAECDIQSVSRDAWKRHILSSSRHLLANDKNLQCKICNSHFPLKSSLVQHLKEHSRALGPRRHAPAARAPALPPAHCDQCGSRFMNRSKLQAHVKRMHLGVKYNKNIVCEVCGRKCTSNASLKYHQRTHTGERPYNCGTCDKKFVDKNQLRIHTRTHTGEKPYCCGTCGKRFSQKPALNRHYRVHTGAKPYPCSYCGKTFSQSNSLKLHVNTVHLKIPPNRKAKQDHTEAGTTVHNL